MVNIEKLRLVDSPTLPDQDPPPAYKAPGRSRLVICVDGTKPDSGASNGQSNIDRIFTGIKHGHYVDDKTGEVFYQIPKYIPAVGSAVAIHHTAIPSHTYQQQIQEVYEECCRLTGADDEVVLLGFSEGAYVVRAVAGLLHHYGALAHAGEHGFANNYKKLIKRSRHANQGFHSPSLSLSRAASVSSQSTDISGSGLSADLRAGPGIRFIGCFDTVNPLSDGRGYDISFNFSIQNLRHAVALHEDRKTCSPELLYPQELQNTQLKDEDRSMVQAWFVGTHSDVGGISPKAGLGLYPLQWMVHEAMACGVGFDLSRTDKPISIAFPPLGADAKPVKIVPFTGANGLVVTLQDLSYVHEKKAARGSSYVIKLHVARATSLHSKKQRLPFDESGRLIGYCQHAPQGTIIHPSVYLLLDKHVNLVLDTRELNLQRDIEDYRDKMLGKKDGMVNLGFWGRGTLEEDEPPDPGAIRVLVCGNTGVGKSTLINKTFGVDVTQSSHRARGIHDVKQEITWEGRQDIIVHDSGGFEAGAEDEFIAIEEFLKEKSAATDIHDRLHVIWFCIDINSARTLQTATQKLFAAVSTYASEVPIVVVATKKDDLLDLEFSHRRKELKKLKEPFNEEVCEQYAEEKLQERLDQIRSEMQSVPGGRLDALVAVSQDDDDSISELSQTTSQCLDTDKVRALYIRAQVTRIDLKVDLACAEVFRRYKKLVQTATAVSFTFIGPTAHSKSAARAVCKAILNCFGLPSVSADNALEVLKETVWDHLGYDPALAISECLNTIGYVSTGLIAGAPMFLIAGMASAPMVVPATCRLFLTMACDLMLVLARSFKEVAFTIGGQPRENDVQAAARLYRLKGYSQHVHGDIKILLPRRKMLECFKFSKVQDGIEVVMRTYKDNLLENLDLPFTGRRGPKVRRADPTAVEFDDDEVTLLDHGSPDDDTFEADKQFYKALEMVNKEAEQGGGCERSKLEALERQAFLDGRNAALSRLEEQHIIPGRTETIVRGFYA